MKGTVRAIWHSENQKQNDADDIYLVGPVLAYGEDDV
jgi:hypothetical protein